MMDKIGKVEIVETQQESEIDDELLFTLFVDGKTVSWAKTILYGNLSDIHTAFFEKRKGYGRMLLSFIENNAQKHCTTSMRTSDFNACNAEATNFFKNMLYEVNPCGPGLNAFVRATKFFK